MKENFYKYACLLLDKGLNIQKGQPLVITAPIESIEFIRVLSRCALDRGVSDIYFDWIDDELKHQQLLYFDENCISKSLFFNKKVYDEYAKKDAAFLMLISENPDIMKDVSSSILDYASRISRTSRPFYKKRQSTNDVAWCIASVSTYGWAKKIFGDSLDCVNKLWNLIFKICLIDSDDPIKDWDKKLMISSKRCDVLNKLKIKTLHYTNNLGTDLYVGLSYGSKWCGAGEAMPNGRKIVANIPSEEIFTSPNRLETRGIVYSSKPLVYSGSIIDDFFIKFENGKVVDYGASKGCEILKSIIEGDSTSCYLGECALVPYDSPISNSGIIFYTTLFDENASCHLALGTGFPNTLDGTDGKDKEELLSMGLNVSDVHVDFMIGTSDLQIEGVTYEGDNVLIFKDGNFYLDV
jgi:aminopeptidase